MFLSEGIIDNFIETIDESDLVHIQNLNDEGAFEYLASLYQQNYGAAPSGAGIYLLRSKFKLGNEEQNRKYIPSSLF